MNYNIRWEEKHAIIFSNLVSLFNENNIKYFILRNYEGLPNDNKSKDIDIIIEPGSYKLSKILLEKSLKNMGVSHNKIVKYERVRCFYGIDVSENFSIHIDLIEGYLSKGVEIFTFKELYENTEFYMGFRVLNKPYDIIMLLYYKVIGTRQLNDRYRNKISKTYKEEKTKIDIIFKKTLNDYGSNLIINALENNKFEDIIFNANLFSRITKRKSFLKRPIKTSINIFKFLLEKFYRIIYCPKKYQNFISVQGADGTGKTTFIEGLTKAVAYYYVAEDLKSHLYHFRPTVLPNLGAAGEKAGVMKEDKDFTNPHRAKPVGPINSFLRMTYYWLDYVIGVPVKLRKDVQFDRFTIYDRYIYDFLIDPYRSRINLPYWIRKIFTRLVLQPRIVFILLTDAEIIYERKQELTLVEIKRQLGEFSKLANSHERFIILDASKSPDTIVEDAMNIIIEKFTQKL